MGSLATPAFAQKALTWQQLKQKFESTNPTLQAAKDNIDESRAEEVTAYLRPNPDFNLTVDGFQVSRNQGVWQPFSGVFESPGISYLHERQHKRELRLQSAKQTTDVTVSQYTDQERSLLFSLRNAFVGTLQAKAVLENAKENLDYWDRELTANRDRFKAGDLAEVDLDRLELQRVQFESDYETALVNLRTSKITLLQLLNDRTPIEEFDVRGEFGFTDELKPLAAFRTTALVARPDLKAAVQSVELAKTNYQLAVANGSTDPTFGIWFTHNASISNPFANNTIGGTVSIPLRIFDRNQGEKARTRVDIARNERLRDAAEAQVFNDVDSAYAALESALDLLRPYKKKYLPLALAVRDRVAFAFQRGGASLLDLLDAEKSYRDTRLAYINLVGSYLVAAAQMNMAVGQEVLE
ncbi:MAG: TolC family protein [Acidobacteriaceae bacterium]|nr:TolC family protein [Acidobacteriaceae bacterium]MBV9498605.1 TolC family protein [Acidobacteriaceae bacterium]